MIWTIIIIAVVVVIAIIVKRSNSEKQLNSANKTNTIPNNTIYKDITGYDEDILKVATPQEGFRKTLFKTLFDNVPTKNNYESMDENCGYNEIDVLLKFLFPKIYISYLKYELFSITAEELNNYVKRLRINIQSFISKNISDVDRISVNFTTEKSIITHIINNYILPASVNLMHKECKFCLYKAFLKKNVYDSRKMLHKELPAYEPKTEIEKLEYSIFDMFGKQQEFAWHVFLINYFSETEQLSPTQSQSDNFKQMNKTVNNIIEKMEDIIRFNNALMKTINVCEEKANKVIIVTYGQVLLKSGINKKQYYKEFDKINQMYSSHLSPIVAASCDATVKKIVAIIKQKQDILDKNNADLAKYHNMWQKIDKQMAEEEQLQKIKELNKEICKFDNETDIVKNEEKNLEFENMIEDINRMEIEVNERRNYEIQFGEIEI